MSKHNSGTKVVDRSSLGIQTTFKDFACPVPAPSESDWGHFSEKDSVFASETTPGPTPAVMKEIQFADIQGGEPGKTDFMRIPGSSRGGGNYER